MKAGKTPQDNKIEHPSNTITFIYPIWRTGLPAILKGYIDRVFSYGFAYRYDEEGVVRMLNGKTGFII